MSGFVYIKYRLTSCNFYVAGCVWNRSTYVMLCILRLLIVECDELYDELIDKWFSSSRSWYGDGKMYYREETCRLTWINVWMHPLAPTFVYLLLMWEICNDNSFDLWVSILYVWCLYNVFRVTDHTREAWCKLNLWNVRLQDFCLFD